MQLKEINRIAVFDFDGTLVNSPTAEKGKVIYQEKIGNPWPHIGWWGKVESLNMDIFDIPVIQSVIDSYNEEKANDSTLMVMLTGRMSKLSNEVEKILNAKSLSFDKYLYNTGGDTLTSKIKSLDKLLIEYPNVNDILLTDDRVAHIPTFESWCKKQVENGRIEKYKINVVESEYHSH